MHKYLHHVIAGLATIGSLTVWLRRSKIPKKLNMLMSTFGRVGVQYCTLEDIYRSHGILDPLTLYEPRLVLSQDCTDVEVKTVIIIWSDVTFMSTAFVRDFLNDTWGDKYQYFKNKFKDVFGEQTIKDILLGKIRLASGIFFDGYTYLPFGSSDSLYRTELNDVRDQLKKAFPNLSTIINIPIEQSPQTKTYLAKHYTDLALMDSTGAVIVSNINLDQNSNKEDQTSKEAQNTSFENREKPGKSSLKVFSSFIKEK